MNGPAARPGAAVLGGAALVVLVLIVAWLVSHRDGARRASEACSDPGAAVAEGCPAACRSSGVVVTGAREARSGGVVDVRATSRGCGGCGDLGVGAPVGSPCESAAVCGEVCCSCAAVPARHVVRACGAGACLGRDEACALTGTDDVLCAP